MPIRRPWMHFCLFRALWYGLGRQANNQDLIFRFQTGGDNQMKNPLESLSSTIVLGLILTVVMVWLVNAIGS